MTSRNVFIVMPRFHTCGARLQVVEAPYIMEMLLAHVEAHGVPACTVIFLTTLACSARTEQRQSIVCNPHVLKLVEAATANDRSAVHATKLKALFATSSAHHMRLTSSVGS